MRFFFVAVFLVSSFSYGSALSERISFDLRRTGSGYMRLRQMLGRCTGRPRGLQTTGFLVTGLPFHYSSINSRLSDMGSTLHSIVPRGKVVSRTLGGE